MNVPAPGTLLVLSALAVGVGMWGIAAFRWRRGERLLGPRAPITVAEWGAAAGAAVWFATMLIRPPEDAASPALWSTGRAAVAAVGAGIVWSVAARSTGEPRRTLTDDFRDGVVAVLLALPPVAVALLLPWPERTVAGSNPLVILFADGPWPVAALVAFGAVALAPVGEELLFRGLFLGSLRKAGVPAAAAILGTAALFAVVHPPQDWASLFVLACVLGWCRERTGSVRPAIVAHALFNALMLSWVLLDGWATAG